MAIFKRKKSDEAPQEQSQQQKPVKVETVAPKVEAKKAEKKIDNKIKGKTALAYRVLLKPLVTEKAAHLANDSKYLFAVDPSMNKVEVKKAIRSIYNVEPVSVNIINQQGKKVKYGRISGNRKDWKKAVVTLKKGETIEVYEGV